MAFKLGADRFQCDRGYVLHKSNAMGIAHIDARDLPGLSSHIKGLIDYFSVGAVSVVGISVASKRGSPISTVIRPSGSSLGVISPPKVWMV